MKFLRGMLLVVLVLAVSASLSAQFGQTGSIRGHVLDNQKAPLPGVTITVTSPALMGKQSVVSAVDGTYKFPPILPPGIYTALVELQGFKSMKRGNINVRVASNVDVDFEMTQTTISEEVSVVAASPVVDVVSTAIAQNATTELIETLPFANRDVWTFAGRIAAGARGNRPEIHGEGPAAFTFTIDGIQATASDQNYSENSVDMETVQEVEFQTGGVDSSAYGARSGFMNVVTKSGGNAFNGMAQFYYTGRKLQQVLPAAEQLAALGISNPTFADYSYDTSATLGGPILNDKLWFFASFKYYANKAFIAYNPVTITDPYTQKAIYYGPYDQISTRPYYFGKLTYQINPSLKIFGSLSYVDDKIPHYYTGPYMTASASANNNPVQTMNSNGLTWVINPDTILDIRGGFYIQDWTGVGTKEAILTGPTYTDTYTGYNWGKRNMDSYTYKKNINIKANVIRYLDDVLGANHEFQAGVEYAYIDGQWGYWSQNPMTWQYYNGNPYWSRGNYNTLNAPHPLYGDGSLTFDTFGTKRGGAQRVGFGNRYSGFIQDSMTFGRRLTVTVGLRYDYMHTEIPVQVKTAAAGELAAAIGEAYIVPTYGFNPYKQLTYEGWDNPYAYKALAPTIGASYDLFGDGKTALKLHYGAYYDPQNTSAVSSLQPSGPYSFSFWWWDTNLNGLPDMPGTDTYAMKSGQNPALMQSTLFKRQLDPNIKFPYTHEFIAQVEHELFPFLKVGANFIYRARKNFQGSLSYDEASATYWNLLEQHPEWWVPFKTTVPAYGTTFPARDVTVYYRSNNSPAAFTKQTNVPQQKFHYTGLELTWEKRMHAGWSLGGSFSYSYQWANGGFGNPNSRINAEGRGGVPWWVKLYGTFKIPYGFVASFIYIHTEGGYWARSVSVSAPSAWITANNVASGSVGATIESPDLRRNVASDNMDFRLEKEFTIKSIGRLGIFMDIFNLFGAQYPTVIMNPGGTWSPVAEGANQSGTFTPASLKVSGISGVRNIRLSARFSF